ncbi:peptidoglycan DD-metalloendopeptidase family protein [Lentisalinibacter sediminis]|uniref:peptidoglycan DD-metalloendopeptidase family protein n=1 Tax=Lentisalinibacter sediminis TaxID=2992237 RepID=UPI003870174E
MGGLTRALALCLAAALLAACGGRALNWEADVPAAHIVRSGDTLYSIAWRYGLQVRDVARWNGLGDGSLIHPGQRIVLRPTAAGTSRSAGAAPDGTRSGHGSPRPVLPDLPSPAWRWPTDGAITAGFGEENAALTGVLIEGRMGQEVRAAADGEVVYAGSGLIGYGNLVIIKHNATYLSAYGHNRALHVAEGETVKQGERIAEMGEGPGRKPRLHFEIRRNGEPVDPRPFLPRGR